MKIRNGYVSNSSTSSFVLVGFFTNDDEVSLAEKLFGSEETFPKEKPPTRVRGCQHEESDAKYCSQCGRPMWIEKEYRDEYEDDVLSQST